MTADELTYGLNPLDEDYDSRLIRLSEAHSAQLETSNLLSDYGLFDLTRQQVLKFAALTSLSRTISDAEIEANLAEFVDNHFCKQF